MLSFQDLYTFCQNQTFDTSSAGLTIFKQNLNSSLRVIYAKKKWAFLEALKTKSTVASQRAYEIPNSIRKLSDVYITVGDTTYQPRAVEDPTYWKRILARNSGESDVQEFMYVQGKQVLFDPIPASSSNTISFRGRKIVKDLAQADYTTGTITSIANGATTVTGNGTTWTAAMVGRWIKFSGATGDGMWYEIASRTSNTVIELAKPYEGTSIAAATDTFVIGEMSELPESYQELPLWRTLALHYQRIGDPVMAKIYWDMYDGGCEAGFSPEIGGLLGQMMQDLGETFEGNYVSPLPDVNLADPNDPPLFMNTSNFT